MKKIESTQNALVKHMVKLRKDRTYRYQQRSVFVEGKKIIRELANVKRLFVEDNPEGIDCDEVYQVNPVVMGKLSGVKTPEGMIAEVEMPEEASLDHKRYVLVFDGVSDPGHMGTIIRTGLALGWEGVLLLDKACDPFNEKAIRASKGAVFRMPLCRGSLEQINLPCYVADLEGKSVDDIETDGLALVLSNESQGVTEETRKKSQSVTIPMKGEMESLNVAIAGGILMYLLRKHD